MILTSFKYWLRGVTLTIIASMGLSSGIARADFVQGILTGQIDAVDESMETTAGLGDPFTATYLIDLDTPDLMPDSPIDGVYQITSVTLEVGHDGITLAGPTVDSGLIIWAYPAIKDRYAMTAHLPSPLSGISSPVFWAVLSSWNEEAPVFLTDSIPTSLDLDDFESAWFSFENLDMPGPRISGNIDSLDLRVIPDPTTLSLLAAGTAAIIARHRRLLVASDGACSRRVK